MPFFMALALCGILCSLIASLGYFVLSSRKDKSEYELWLDEIKSKSIVQSRTADGWQ